MRKDTKYPPFFASNFYYNNLKENNLLVTARQQTYLAATALKKNSGITLLYFLDDHGKLLVNASKYPICNGLFVLLGSYHYYQILPDSEKNPMEVIQVQMNYHTFLFMAGNPYYRFDTLDISSRPLFSKPNADMNKLASDTLKKLVAISAKQKDEGSKSEILLGMEIMGIFQKSLDPRSFESE